MQYRSDRKYAAHILEGKCACKKRSHVHVHCLFWCIFARHTVSVTRAVCSPCQLVVSSSAHVVTGGVAHCSYVVFTAVETCHICLLHTSKVQISLILHCYQCRRDYIFVWLDCVFKSYICIFMPPLRTLHLSHISSLMLAWCKEGTVSQVLSY